MAMAMGMGGSPSPTPLMAPSAGPLALSPLQRLFPSVCAPPLLSGPSTSSSSSAAVSLPSSARMREAEVTSPLPPSLISPPSPPPPASSPESLCGCLPCLLSRLQSTAAPSPLLSHLPPQWQRPRVARKWRRKAELSEEGEGGGEEAKVGEVEDGHRRWPCVGPRQPRPRWRGGRVGGGAQPHIASPQGRRGRSGAPSLVASSRALDEVSRLHGFLSHRSIPLLLRQTNYSRWELFSIFLRFKSLCCLSPDSGPAGIDAATFQRGVVRLSVEDDRFVHRVFALVDTDNSNSIEWEEFLVAMAALEKGSAEIKAKFACQVYDLDGDGFIGRHDLTTMFQASSMLKQQAAHKEDGRQEGEGGGGRVETGSGEDDELSDAVIAMFVTKVFETFGCAESGLIAFEDVLAHMKNNGSTGDVWDFFGRSIPS